MIYFVGGGARCGKSTLARKLLERLPRAAYLSGDSFRQAIKPVLPLFHTIRVEASSPEAYIRHYKEHAEEAITESLRQSEAIWPFIERYVNAYFHESSCDLVVESIDIWPQFVGQVQTPHRAVFLVDSNLTQWQRVMKHSRRENDWITAKGLTQDQVEAWAFYNAQRSRRVAEEARRYGYESFDIEELGFDKAQERSLEEALQVTPGESN